jgi:Xaa-Pro aminopeptidase/Xaa-Pro dipeptidase
MDNMTITIEPGIYLESKFGVRIEDSIMIASKNSSSSSRTGIINFNKFEKDLIII